jgi:hypothetical protein
MMRGTRLVGLVMVVAVALAGPLAPYAAAQQPPGQAMQPTLTPAPPDLYQQQLKQQAEETSAYNTGAAIANVVYVPGKAILCGLGAITGFGILLVTFGSGYKAAAFIGREGCGGRWILHGEDIRPDGTLADWERY